MRLARWLSILLLVVVLSTGPADGFGLFFWRKKPTWVREYMLKHGVHESMADAALKGLTEEQLLGMSRMEARVLCKLLKGLQRTVDETRALVGMFGPLDKMSEKQNAQLQQASLYLASSMRRSVDVVFDAMEGKLHDPKLWKLALHNAHTFVMDSVCQTFHSHQPWFCHEGKRYSFHKQTGNKDAAEL